MSWQIEAEYLENCNCEILCPCVTSPVMKGSYDRCLVPLVVRIARGQKDGVSLDGLGFVWLVDAPGTMSEGGWRVGIYLDEQATPEQAAALEEIVTGRAGGVPGIIGSLTGELVGIKHVPFEFTPGGNVWSARPDRADDDHQRRAPDELEPAHRQGPEGRRQRRRLRLRVGQRR